MRVLKRLAIVTALALSLALNAVPASADGEWASDGDVFPLFDNIIWE